MATYHCQIEMVDTDTGECLYKNKRVTYTPDVEPIAKFDAHLASFERGLIAGRALAITITCTRIVPEKQLDIF